MPVAEVFNVLDFSCRLLMGWFSTGLLPQAVSHGRESTGTPLPGPQHPDRTLSFLLVTLWPGMS